MRIQYDAVGIGMLLAIAVPARAQTTPTAQATTWPIRLEEPTGIERREREVVSATLSFAPGQAREQWLRVMDDRAREVALQVHALERHRDGSLARAELLFPEPCHS